MKYEPSDQVFRHEQHSSQILLLFLQVVGPSFSVTSLHLLLEISLRVMF
jgi:hypothetical protein